MDFQSLVSSFAVACCVMSVEKTPEGGFGEIRILCANEPYRRGMGSRYHDNMIYSDLVPKDIKFEDFVYRAAVLGERMHAYVDVKAMDGWIDQLMIPLVSDREDMGYCLFQYEFTEQPEAGRMAKVSADTASAVIRACITLLGTADFLERVKSVLSDLRRQTGAFGCRVMLLDREKKEAVNFCESNGILSDNLEGDGVIPYETVASWEELLGVSNAIIVKNEREMDMLEQESPEWVKSMRLHHVESLVLIPLRQGKQVFGYLYVVNFDVEKVVQVKELVELISFFLGSEIYNYLLMDKLEKMSQTDGLTGLHNRNAMIHRIAQLTQEKGPYGIVNLDLNGLKVVNDREGHAAGDAKLVEAAEALKKVFYDEDLYRTGGDEFIVISSDVDREVFQGKVERLRRSVEEHSELSFAMGSCWSEGQEDVTASFRHADEMMYADKEAFYAHHPELRRDYHQD